MPNSHLDCGNESDFSDKSVTASELSEDGPLITPCRRSKSLIVDDSEDDMYDEM